MRAKLNDLLASGLVWVASEIRDRFVAYANANGVFTDAGRDYRGGVILTLKKVYVR